MVQNAHLFDMCNWCYLSDNDDADDNDGAAVELGPIHAQYSTVQCSIQRSSHATTLLKLSYPNKGNVIHTCLMARCLVLPDLFETISNASPHVHNVITATYQPSTSSIPFRPLHRLR
jgi:hypothetical protein